MLDQQDQGFPRIQSMCPQHLVAWRPFAVEDQIHARRSDHMDSPRLFSPPLEAGGALSRGGKVDVGEPTDRVADGLIDVAGTLPAMEMCDRDAQVRRGDGSSQHLPLIAE